VHSRLTTGDRVPDFVMPSPAGTPARFYALAGGRPVTLLLGDEGVALHAEISDALSHRDDVEVVRIDSDTSAKVFGVPVGAATAVLLDANLRVIGEVESARATADVAAMLDLLLPAHPPTQVTEQAPVMFVPRVLSADERLHLIRVVHRQVGVETGVERVAAGTSAEVIEDSFKRRRDHAVRDPALLRQLAASIGRRVMPEIQKAFAFRATRFEGFKIGCYDSSTGGFFRPHRDNLSPSTAHRVFALTVNLNDDYTGGELRFPEYGNQLYRPDAGTALIFSCAHLHEVRDVTAGQRFVLLSFLYRESGTSSPP
jgi:predicted 2-oxoglutarate/Fe(II)-dependent dioxygenase YbiX